MGKTIDIGGRIHNPEVGNVVTGANEILDDTKNKKQDVINSEVDTALEALNANKQDNLTFDQTPTEDGTNPVTSGGVYAADLALQQAIEAILTLIPSAASALNQLADKSFVNSSIATASATFRGTYNLVSDLHLSVTASHQDIATALASAVSTADNNDYCFVQIPTSDTSSDIRVTERYKFNGTAWAYEYDLNNSGFTQAQWDALNSTITLALVQKLSSLPTAAELATSLAGKQNTLTFDNVPVSGSDNPVKSGGLYQLFTAIDAKFPSDASANNKLVAENRLAAYVTAIIEALDASFDLTSADGHVTFKMTQADGVITSVQILTSDIASASALTTLGGQVSTNASDIAALQALYNALQQSAPQIIEPTDTWPVANPSTTVIYRVIDRVNTPPQYYSDYMWNGTTMVLMATYNNAIDNEPILNSNNLVKSGGVYKVQNALKNSLTTKNLPILAGYNNADATVNDKLLYNTGTLADREGYKTSPYLPIPNGTTIIQWVGLFPSVGSFCGLCLYSDDFTFLAYLTTNVYTDSYGNIGRVDITQYTSAKFLRFTTFSGDLIDALVACCNGDYDFNSKINGTTIASVNVPSGSAAWKLDNVLNNIGNIFINFHSPGNVLDFGIYDMTVGKWIIENTIWGEQWRYAEIPDGHNIRVYASTLENHNVDVSVEILPESALKNILTDIAQKQKEIAQNIPSYIDIGPEKEYTRLRDGITAAYITKNSVVRVFPGTYDLMEEFASEIEAHSGGSKGILLGNGMHVIFLPGAYVKSNYVPSGDASKDDWVATYFQPFTVDNSDFTIENLNIEASNTRYCVHDELAGAVNSSYIHRYINCRMKMSYTYQGVNNYTQCIGGGIGQNAYIEIIGGHYESKNIENTNVDAISYHNGSNVNADSSIFIRDLYLSGNNYIRFGAYGPSQTPVRLNICGCSMGAAIRNQQEIAGGSATLAELTEWNNIIRQ